MSTLTGMFDQAPGSSIADHGIGVDVNGIESCTGIAVERRSFPFDDVAIIGP